MRLQKAKRGGVKVLTFHPPVHFFTFKVKVLPMALVAR